MTNNETKQNSSRREFFKKSLVAAGLLGIGCYRLSAESNKELKALTDSGMSFDEVFEFAFGGNIMLLKNFEEQLGKDKLYALIKNAQKDMAVQNVELMKGDLPDRSMKSLTQMMEGVMSVPPYSETHTTEFTEKTDTALEMKYSRCIYSELFKKMDATELGYVCICSPSKDFATAFNPKMEFKNPKNMMKGDDYCIERFELKA